MSASSPPSPHSTLPSSAICRCRTVSSPCPRIESFFPGFAAGKSLLSRPSSGCSGGAILRRFPVQAAARGNGGGRGEGEGEEDDDLRTTPKGDRNPFETNYGNGEGTKGENNRRSPAALPLEIRWRDILNPDPDNIVAVALTGLLALASVQALWQIFFISLAILLAALKYSFIAALLLFIVITLL